MNRKSRDRVLRKIGFASYRDYINSSLWSSIREKVFALHGRYCLLCGNKATQLHHNNYSESVLRGFHIKPIKPVCGECHRWLHYGDTDRFSLRKSITRFRESRNKNAQNVRKIREAAETSHLMDLLLNYDAE